MKGRPIKIMARLLGTTTVGARLQMLRMAQDLSLEQLAKKAGIDPQYLERLEGGTSYPRAAVRHKLAKALKVTEAELLE